MSGKPKIGGDIWNDPDHAPALGGAFFQQATVYEGDRIVRRGRPKTEMPKQQVTLRLDADVLTGLRATGPGWQTRPNEVLKIWLEGL
jgi:uncharacterized protein (DUF4415 family)